MKKLRLASLVVFLIAFPLFIFASETEYRQVQKISLITAIVAAIGVFVFDLFCKDSGFKS